jgi:hypothetical protein
MRSPSLALVLPALPLTFALVAGLLTQACGGETITVGRTDQTIKKQADGGPTGNGRTCSWNDSISSDGTITPSPDGAVQVGETVPSPDGCNTCSCTEQGFACTEMACAPPPGNACTYDGKSYAKGATFPSTDGCNTCSCTTNGVACTEMACAKTCVVGNKTYQDGDTWAEACNSCGCSGGQVNCTAMACP